MRPVQGFISERPRSLATSGPERHLVVACYNEDVSWLPTGMPVTLYSKSQRPSVPPNVVVEPLDNIGRESHTYLSHIVLNYESLADITVFCQGNPYPHSVNFHKVIEESNLSDMLRVNLSRYYGLHVPIPTFVPLGFMWRYNPKYPWKSIWRDNGEAMLRVWELLGYSSDISFPFLVYNGAQFAVSREAIHRRPLVEYERLLNAHHEQELLPWALEIMWPLVFNAPKMLI